MIDTIPMGRSMDPPPHLVREQMARILASPRFTSSERLRALLRYTVEETLAGRGESIKESVLGVEVFERDASYDPRIDPVVRVMAGRLRNRLAEYYGAEGRADPLRIDFPRGTYVPQFGLPSSEPAVPVDQSQRVPGIAVLPLASLSPDPEQEFFSDGMADAIITDLAKIAGLRVISRTSVMQFKKSSIPVPEIVRILDVGYVLEGSVLHAGRRVRITVQLIACPPERHVWAESYERDLSDVLRLQSEIARQVASEIHVRLTPGERSRLSHPPAVNPEAYLKYLQGKHHWHRLGSQTSIREGIACLEEAVRMDPSFAAAWAEMGEACQMVARYAYSAAAAAKARQAIETALALDDTSAAARTLLAMILLDNFEWKRAREELEKVLAMHPNHALAHLCYGELLIRHKDFEPALQELELARSLDPLSPLMANQVGVGLLRARKCNEAMALFRRSAEMDPQFVVTQLHLVLGCLCVGKYDEAIQHARQVIDTGNSVTDMIGMSALAHLRSGRRESCQELLADLERRKCDGEIVGPHILAALYTALGDHGRALDWLEQAVEQRTFVAGYLAVEFYWDDLRAEPRFHALLKKVGLPED
ncbi:MAG: hypothetical protein C5B51_09925 [Terriglobia bacterium]|nr:MAG: hypothetical protein C5B51_09925 [Terriglobia bacterium]